MAQHTQIIHSHTDVYNVTHHYALLPSVELYLKGNLMEIQVGNHRVKRFIALLDTGASNSYLGQGIADYNKLQLLRKEKASFGNGDGDINVYENITLKLPHNLGNFNIEPRTSGAKYIEMGVSYQIIIGMDILMKGKFSLENNNYTLEFP